MIPPKGANSYPCIREDDLQRTSLRLQKFTPTGDMPIGILRQTSTLLSDGTVMLLGGTGSSGFDTLLETQLYSPQLGTPSE